MRTNATLQSKLKDCMASAVTTKEGLEKQLRLATEKCDKEKSLAAAAESKFSAAGEVCACKRINPCINAFCGCVGGWVRLHVHVDMTNEGYVHKYGQTTMRLYTEMTSASVRRTDYVCALNA